MYGTLGSAAPVRMYELKTQRLKAVVDAAKDLKELGVRISLKQVAEQVVHALKGESPDELPA